MRGVFRAPVHDLEEFAFLVRHTCYHAILNVCPYCPTYAVFLTDRQRLSCVLQS
jgi:nitrite reductase/ring-hydroxylating ferredoxin subunit